MTTVEHVNEIIGDVPFTTSTGKQISSVFVPLVKEYLDVVETGSFDETVNYIASEKAALEVKKNIKILASKISGISSVNLIPNLKVLPVDLYDLVQDYVWLLTLDRLPVAGSKEKEEYDNGLLGFRKKLSHIVSSKFGLPNITVQGLTNYSNSINILAGKDVSESRRVRLGLRNAGIINALPFSIIAAPLIVGAPLAVSVPIMAFTGMAALFGNLAVAAGGDAYERPTNIVGKNMDKESYGLFYLPNKALKTVKNNFETLTEESRSSMKSYLLQNIEQ